MLDDSIRHGGTWNYKFFYSNIQLKIDLCWVKGEREQSTDLHFLSFESRRHLVWLQPAR